jgi:ribosomal-protein-alanine N-acetyltransferase
LDAWRIEPMRQRDVRQVAEIEAASFRSPWPARAFIEELKHAEVSRCFVARGAGKDSVLGYICCWEVGDELMINNLAVSPTARRGGIGRALLRRVLEDAKAAGCATAWLEVRPSNAAAIHLYQAHGFSIVSRRRGYYTDTREDALIMRTFLESP